MMPTTAGLALADVGQPRPGEGSVAEPLQPPRWRSLSSRSTRRWATPSMRGVTGGKATVFKVCRW